MFLLLGDSNILTQPNHEKICFFFCVCTIVLTAQAQGTRQFAATLTNDLYSRTASFTLTGTNLKSFVTSVGLDTADIRGPGLPGSGAPTILYLGLRGCDPPVPDGTPGDCYFFSNLSLTGEQVSELSGGQWYIDAYSTRFPGRQDMQEGKQ